MESFLQKLAKKREAEHTVTVLPVLTTKGEHGASCDCGEEGCTGDAEGGCCGG